MQIIIIIMKYYENTTRCHISDTFDTFARHDVIGANGRQRASDVKVVASSWTSEQDHVLLIHLPAKIKINDRRKPASPRLRYKRNGCPWRRSAIARGSSFVINWKSLAILNVPTRFLCTSSPMTVQSVMTRHEREGEEVRKCPSPFCLLISI